MGNPDPWPKLLESVAVEDGLPVRECGSWTERKLHFWAKYIDITTRSMVDHRNWPEGLVYVDLFAGPGICEIRSSKKRLPGSPLIAAAAPKPFRKIIVVELAKQNAAALSERLLRVAAPERVKVIEGSCSEVIEQVIDEIPPRALTLAFVDPEDFDVPYTMLEKLTGNGRRVDVLILFADAIDLVRNVDLYERMPESKLYSTLGDPALWLDDWRALENRSGAKVREFFSRVYARMLRERLGYAGVRQEIIQGPSGPLYRLVYASKNERGLDFWDKIASRELGGQGRLF